VPGEISEQEIRERLNRIVLKAASPVALATAALYAILTAANWMLMPAELGRPLALMCGGTAAGLIAVCAGTRVWRPPPAASHLLVGFVGICILLNALFSQHLSGDPQHSLFIVMLIVGAGVVFLSVRWLVGTFVVCVGSWGALVLATGELPGWSFYLTSMGAGVFLSTTVHAIRYRTIVRLIELRQRERSQREKLQRSNRDLESFAYTVSHDLREPLRTISGFLALLDRRHSENMDDEAREFLRFAREGASSMESMIADVLTYSRVGGRPAKLAQVQVGAAVDAALGQLGSAIERSGAVVTVPDDLPTVEADITDLVRLLQNLIFNAIRYRSRERTPEIGLEVEREGDFWRFAVTDNGVGIDPEEIDRLFGLFQRSSARTDDSGTGVGLAVCRKIVSRYEGRIWAESELGAGSTFYFTLPVSP
jgi:signal transduction histidine kinase